VHDGLRAVKNALEDGSVVPGAGAFEVAAHAALTSAEFMNSVQGRAKYGVKVSVYLLHCNDHLYVHYLELLTVRMTHELTKQQNSPFKITSALLFLRCGQFMITPVLYSFLGVVIHNENLNICVAAVRGMSAMN